jgi:uncharacterized membrane protein YccC
MIATIQPIPMIFAVLSAFWRGLIKLPRDGAFRFSVKFGLAGILAVYVTLLNKSHQPTWALFTVFVLMVGQYIGAVEEKSILRMVGTVIGGLVGYILTASLEQDPLIYLSLLGLFVAFATAMFGQSRYPYAFLLCGMTAVVVSSNGLSNPEMSWTFMIWRIQEVFIGIVAVMLVQSLLWPRYAAAEFLNGLRGIFLDLRDLIQAARSGNPTNDLAFDSRLNQLRQLLRFGGRESRYFRAKLDTYVELLTCVQRLHGAMRPLAEIRLRDSFYQESLSSEVAELRDAIECELSALGSANTSNSSLRDGLQRISNAMESLKKTIRNLRQDPRSREANLGGILEMNLEFLSLEEIHLELACCLDLLEGLPSRSKKSLRSDQRFLLPGVPNSFWITNGIRSALSMVTAMVFMNWLQPPGGVTMVLCAWLFCCLLPSSPEGRGDHRAWHVVVAAVPCVLLLSLALLFVTPLLSSYAVMNVLIFTWLFVYGQIAYSTPGVTTVMNIAMMALVSIVGLNAQEPVNFQSIADVFFGISTGTLIAAFFQRTLWPLLPQREMRDRFVEMLDMQRGALARGALTPDSMARLSLLPGEIKIRLANLARPIYTAGEVQNLRNLLDHLDRFSANRIWESNLGQIEGGGALTAKIRDHFSKVLEKISTSFSTGQSFSMDCENLRATMREFEEWIAAWRLKMMEENADPLLSSNLLGQAARYQHASEYVIAAAETAATLETSIYSGDNSL